MATPERDESPAERLDRQLIELLNEVRVALPGVQVIFAFLLILPFQTGFADVTRLQRGVYFATLLLTALATACLLAPVGIHRLRFRRGDKEAIVEWAHRLTLCGLVVLALAVAGAVFLVTDVLFGVSAAAIVAAALLGVTVALWFALPLSRRVREPD
jgi:hypothetical protein